MWFLTYTAYVMSYHTHTRAHTHTHTHTHAHAHAHAVLVYDNKRRAFHDVIITVIAISRSDVVQHPVMSLLFSMLFCVLTVTSAWDEPHWWKWRRAAPCGPGAAVGVSPGPSLTGVDPEVGFEVGRLPVHLPAAGEGAAVSLLGGLLPPRRFVPGLFGGHRAPAVPGPQPAAGPLHLLQRAGVGAPETPAGSSRVTFVQVQ